MSVASWAPNTYYLIGDIVNNGSANYQCVKVNLSSASNKPPNVTYWTPYGGSGTNYSAGVGIQFQTPVGGATPIATSLVAGSNMSFSSNGNAITLNAAGGSGNVTNPLSSTLDCATYGLSNAGYLTAPTITGTYNNTSSNFPITINSDIITFSNPLGGLDRTTLSNIGTAAISNITTLQNVAGQGGVSNYINYTSGIDFGSFSNSILGCSNIQTSNINGAAYPPAALPSGLLIGDSVTWLGFISPSGPNCFYATISNVSANLTSNSTLSCATQYVRTGDSNPFLDDKAQDTMEYAWILAVSPSSADDGSITFTVGGYPNQTGDPLNPINLNYGIAWAVTKF